MDLLDRYLEAVRKYLPWKRQEDIIAELRANLESQLEDKESELGRPLTTSEVEAWLKKLGAPRQVAAGYQRQQYLIGPALFPTFTYVLRTVCIWVVVVYTIVSAVQIAVNARGLDTLPEAVMSLPGVLLMAAAWVTLIFAVLEFVAARYPQKCPALANPSADWSPSALPPVQRESAQGKKPRSYVQAVAEVVFGFIFLVWLVLVPQHPFLLLGPGVIYLELSPFRLAPVWLVFLWWVVALNVLQLVWRSIDLMRGTWQYPWAAQHLVFKTIGLVPLALLLFSQGHMYIVLKHPELDQARYGANLDTINHAIHWALLVAATIAVLQLLFDIGKLAMDANRKRLAAMR